jgi:hypothetical protein
MTEQGENKYEYLVLVIININTANTFFEKGAEFKCLGTTITNQHLI